ncbi:dipeptide/oligopeptide/nickel ABC transporter ATP-binding protein [Tepiditoga spiralis]|uniref:Dipeptide/oligopeptide/nickel ABC transporter ATP-binding protein n=1 Tax=Tepiditoga spiralis TaxID=2108365 RepID=A0A7G1G8U3_9BACT|nr:ABC transporter ATP-binding protein [Tepiditoga spiralis]BBE31664.1 dipeptide/oligopeptide/nickel ABC transporter ATP-binding protein [Tepiditoga spiralis]
MSKNILNVNDLKVYYKTLKGYVKALDGISFKVNEKEILGVAGESGCGKTTLGHSLILLKKPMKYISGEANLLNKDLMKLNAKEMNKTRFKDISIIPQAAMDSFSPTKKIKDFIKDLVEEHGIKADENFFEKVKKRFKMVNLSLDVLNRYSIELSGGMKQRVILVISTLLDPKLLIADEITSALDVSSQKFVAKMLSNFRDEKIVDSIIFITHDLSILYQIADKIMIMYAGHIAEIASSEDIIFNPKHPYTKALISSLPKIGTRFENEKLDGIEGTPPNLLNFGNGCRFRFRCPYAFDKCEKEAPPKTIISNDHEVYCWLNVGDKNE